MRLCLLITIIWLLNLTIWCPVKAAESRSPSDTSRAKPRTFAANGTVEEIRPEAKIIVIRHEVIADYMAAMTMPFNVKNQAELAGLHAGDEIKFELQVTDNESWVDRILKTGAARPVQMGITKREIVKAPDTPLVNPLLDYKFTNELGQAVSLNEFHGQALAVTFFYTRCPLPEFCPRLSKNFQEASQKLQTMTNSPANWRFLSISLDTEFDSPAVLKAYGESYQYNPAHWNFLTGPPDKIAGLAGAAGVSYEADNGTINHNFRTLIIDATGHLQMVFPTGGNLSDQIATEIVKAAAVTNPSVVQNQTR